MANVTIVGAGYMGTATAWPLADNGHTVRLVGTHLDSAIITSCRERHYHPRLQRRLPPGVQSYDISQIAGALDGAEVIVSGVNSLGVHWIGRTLGPYLQPGQAILAVTKGLEATENGDLLILPEVLYDELPAGIRDRVQIAAVGGPCIAGELAGRRPSCVMFGSCDGKTIEPLADIFRTSYYHVWTTTDLMGLEVCAALKNGYTLGVGAVAGLLERAGGVDEAGAHMYNLTAAVFAQACTEMARMLEVMGGTPAFAYGLPGAGDHFVTCQGGRSTRLGRLLGLGHSYAHARETMAGETLEAAECVRVMGEALPKLTARGILGERELPLMRALADVVVRGQPLNLPLDAFY